MDNKMYACFARLEAIVCDLYETMIERTDSAQVKLLLDKILQESKGHKLLLTRMAGLSGPEMLPSTVQCNKELGEMFRDSVLLLSSLRDQVMSGMTVVEAARKLVDFENGVGEEYLIQADAKLLAEVEADFAVKEVLQGIAEDEKSHARALQLILKTTKPS